MSKKLVVIIVIVLLVTSVLFMITRSAGDGKEALISPVVRKVFRQPVPALTPAPMPVSQTPSYNPPKEIHYNGSTDLKQELESVNPEVLESDFE